MLSFTRTLRSFSVALGAMLLPVGLTAGLLLAPSGDSTATARAEQPVLVAQKTTKSAGKKKASSGATGTLKGTVLFDGAAPALAAVIKKGDSSVKDAAVCSAETVPDESLVVDSATKGIANVFIYLAKAPDGYKAPAAPKEPVVFDQKGCRFLPHALVVRAGQTINVLSDDAIAHNTHTFPIRNTGFNQAIKANDRAGVPLVYTKAEKLPVEVKCDFHPWMKAYHLPLEHPFMAVTDEKGNFEIEGLPAGEHSFIIWQEKAGYLNRKQSVKIKAGGETELKLEYGASKFAGFSGARPSSIQISSSR